jgi:voltage-gated potassium channel
VLRREMHRDIKHLNDEIAQLHGELHALRDALGSPAVSTGQSSRQGEREPR